MVPRVGVCKAEGKVHSVMSLINIAHPSCWIRGCHYFLPLDVCECVGLLHSAPLMFSESPEGKSPFQKLLMVSVVAVCYCQVWSFCWSQFDAACSFVTRRLNFTGFWINKASQMKNAGLQQEQEQWQRRGPSPSPSSYAPCHSICISAWVPFGVSACVSLCVGGLCFVCAAVLTVRCLGRWVSEDHSKEADLKTRQCVHKSLSNSQSILILLRIFFF